MLSAARWLTVAHRVSLDFRRSLIPASAPPRPVATRRGVGTPNLSRGLGTAAGMADPDGVADARFDASGVEIEIPLPPPIGTKRLQRPADEPAGKALARLRATVEKARKKTASKKKKTDGDGDAASPPPPIATLRESPSGAALDPETPNADAWVSGRTLVVDGVGSFRVRVNAPSLESVAVAGDPVVGSPLVAAPFGARHCDEDEDLAYEWFRRVTRDDTDGADAERNETGANAGKNAVASDVLVGVGRAYVPTPADEGRVLVVTATPKPPRGDEAPCGAPASFATARATAAARPRPDAFKRMVTFVPSSTSSQRVSSDERGSRTSDELPDDASVVRIMTYNVLADAYSHTWASLYPYYSAANADPHARLPLAMQDVLLADPEIVALQEVDRKWYGEFWVPQMRAAGYVPAGPLAEKTGLTREGCCVFVKADAWRVVDAAVVSLKDPGPMPEEEATAAFVRTQPHLREALAKISTVGLVVALEPRRSGAENDTSARRPLVVANAHLFFHPGATHVRALQTRWLLRHAQKAREAHARVETRDEDEDEDDDATRRTVGLVVCGDFNAEPFDAAARFAAEGALSAGDPDWALGSVFRWGGTSSRAAAAELASMSEYGAPSESAERDEGGDASGDGDPAATHQKLGRMAACWRACGETERGERARCAVITPPSDSDGTNDTHDQHERDPFVIARHHARNGCTFKTCDVVAAWTFRRDAGMPPGVRLAGVANAPWPGAELRATPATDPDSEGGGGGEPARRLGMGPEWARGDNPASAPGEMCDAVGDDATRSASNGACGVDFKKDFERGAGGVATASDVAAATSAARKALDSHRAVLRSVSSTALALEREAMVELDRANAESGGWVASSIGASGVHMRHPLCLSSACGDPEWTNFVGGFRGALDYVWCDTSDDTPFGAAIIPVAHAPMPPLEAVTRQTALPNDEFPSDHLPMVADVRFVKR
jgi:2',5'-phosphodiesterase